MKSRSIFKRIILAFLLCSLIMTSPAMSYDNVATREERNCSYNISIKNYPRALEWYQKYLDKIGRNNMKWDMHKMLGYLYSENNQDEMAIKEYIIALQNVPIPVAQDGSKDYTNFNGIFSAVFPLTQKNNFDDLYLKFLNICVAKAPQAANLYNLLASYYIGKKDLKNAHQMVLKELDVAPNDIQGFINLALVYYLSGDLSKAKAAIQKTLSIDPTNKLVKLYQAYIPFDTGNFQSSVDLMGPLTKELDNPLLKYRGYLRLALADLFLDKPEEALKAANVAYEIRVSPYSGIVLKQGADYPIVKEVWKGSDAEKAGIKPEDFIETIDGIDLKGKSLEEAKKLLAGTVGTPIVLSVRINTLPPPKAKTGIFIFDAISEASRKKNYKKLLPVNMTRTFSSKVYASDIMGLEALIYRQLGNKDLCKLNTDRSYNLYTSLVAKGASPLDTKYNKLAYNHFLAQYPKALQYIDDANYAGAMELLDKIEAIPDQYKDFISLIDMQKALLYYKLGKNDDAFAILSGLVVDGFNKNNLYLDSVYKGILKEFEPLKQQIEEEEQSQESRKEYNEVLNSLEKLIALSDSKEEKNLLKKKLFFYGQNVTLSQEKSDDLHKYTLRAELLLKDKDYSGALEEYKKALKIAPYLTDLYYNVALVLGELEKYPDAISYMNTYISSEPNAQDLQRAKDEIIKWELEQEKSH